MFIKPVKHLQSLWRHTNDWMSRTMMVAPIVIMAAALTAYTTISTGVELGQIVHRDVQVPYVLSDAVRNMPDDWDAKTMEDYENGLITAFERESRLERSRLLRKTTDALADRIWESGSESFWDEFPPFVFQETVQYFTGKYTGRLLSSAHGELAAEVAEEMSEKVTKEIAGQISEATVEAIQLHRFGNALGEAAYAYGVGEVKKAAPSQQEGPDLSQEVRELVEGMREAFQSKPPQIMVARFQHIINYHQKYSGNLTPGQLAEKIKRDIDVHVFQVMTEEGGSPGSMWEDIDELALWLTTRVVRPDLGPEYIITPKADEDDETGPPQEEEPEATTPVVVSFPDNFFLPEDGEMLAPSIPAKSQGHEIQPPTLEEMRSILSYEGYWGTEELGNRAVVRIMCFKTEESASELYQDLVPEFKTYRALRDNDRRSIGCAAGESSDGPERSTYSASYCQKPVGDHTYTSRGDEGIIFRYRNTIIIVMAEIYLPDQAMTVMQIVDELENNAMRVVDKAIERANLEAFWN